MQAGAGLGMQGIVLEQVLFNAARAFPVIRTLGMDTLSAVCQLQLVSMVVVAPHMGKIIQVLQCLH